MQRGSTEAGYHSMKLNKDKHLDLRVHGKK